MRKIDFKKLILLAVLVALAAVLSYIDGYLCSFVSWGIFHYKLGLANIVVMFVLYNYGVKSSYFTTILKSIIVGFLLGGGLINFVLSFLGSVLSLTGMVCFKKTLQESKFTPFIGLIGGFLHPVGQIIGVSLIYGFKEFLAASLISFPIILIGGIVTGLLVGYTTKKLNEMVN